MAIRPGLVARRKRQRVGNYSRMASRLSRYKPYGNNAVRARMTVSRTTVMLNLNEARDLARDFYGVRRHNRLFARDIR